MRQFFEEQDGRLSMTRLTIFSLVVMFAVQSLYTVFGGKDIPDMPYGLAGFLLALYGINKEIITMNINKDNAKPEGQ